MSRTCPFARISGAHRSAPITAWLSCSTGSESSGAVNSALSMNNTPEICAPPNRTGPAYGSLSSAAPPRPSRSARSGPAESTRSDRARATGHRTGRERRRIGSGPAGWRHRSRRVSGPYAGDPRPRDPERGDLTLLLRSLDEQCPQHSRPYGPLSAPGVAERRILVLGGAKVHALASRKGPPYTRFRRRQITGLAHAGTLTCRVRAVTCRTEKAISFESPARPPARPPGRRRARPPIYQPRVHHDLHHLPSSIEDLAPSSPMRSPRPP